MKQRLNLIFYQLNFILIQLITFYYIMTNIHYYSSLYFLDINNILIKILNYLESYIVFLLFIFLFFMPIIIHLLFSLFLLYDLKLLMNHFLLTIIINFHHHNYIINNFNWKIIHFCLNIFLYSNNIQITLQNLNLYYYFSETHKI
jgi:hypothetical protein